MNTSVECFDLYKDRDSCGNVILNICCVRFVGFAEFENGNDGDHENIRFVRRHASKQKECHYCGLVMHEKSLAQHCKPFMTMTL